MISGLDSFLPPIIPARWTQIRPPTNLRTLPNQETMAWRNVLDSLQVFFSLEDYKEDGIWLHASMTSLNSGRKPPSWSQLTLVKDLFFGDEVAIQLLPKKKDYLNVHSGCLHLFRRVDAPTIPPIWDHE